MVSIDIIKHRYMGLSAYHCVWSVSVYENNVIDPTEYFELQITYLNGSCSVIITDRVCSFYSKEGVEFHTYYGGAQPDMFPSDPYLFVGGLTGVSFLFSQILPAWLFSCKSKINDNDIEVLASRTQADAKRSINKKYLIVPSDDNTITYAIYKGPDYNVTFVPGVQTLVGIEEADVSRAKAVGSKKSSGVKLA